MKAASSRQGAAHRRAVHGEASRQGPTDRDQQIRGLQTGPAHRGPAHRGSAFQPSGTCRPLAQAWQELEGNMHFSHDSVSHFRAALETTGS